MEAIILKPTRRYYLLQKKKAYELLGKVCIKCGFSDWRALQIDHINGKGETTGFGTYKEVIKDPSRFQLLCSNCNWIKRHENREGYQILDPFAPIEPLEVFIKHPKVISKTPIMHKYSRHVTSEVSAWIDSLDIPKTLAEAVEITGETECFKCHSKNLLKKPILYIKGNPPHHLIIYTCPKCGFEGSYKRVCEVWQ